MTDEPAGPGMLLEREEPYFAEFAGRFLLSPEHKYLVASQKGSMPKEVLERFKEGLDRIAKDPFPVCHSMPFRIMLTPSVVFREIAISSTAAP